MSSTIVNATKPTIIILKSLGSVIADKVEQLAPVDASCKFLAEMLYILGLLFGREMRCLASSFITSP